MPRPDFPKTLAEFQARFRDEAAIGADDCARSTEAATKPVSDRLEASGTLCMADPARRAAADLHGRDDQGLVDQLTSTAQAGLRSAHVCLIDLSRSGRTIARRSFWSMAQAVS